MESGISHGVSTAGFYASACPAGRKGVCFKCSALVKMEKALKLETRVAQGCFSTVTM